MAHLKSLTFTVAPQQIARNPKLVRRQRLIDRLEEQQKLAADPTFTVLVRRWLKDPEACVLYIATPLWTLMISPSKACLVGIFGARAAVSAPEIWSLAFIRTRSLLQIL